jgi:agmatine deiminase
LNSNRNPHLTRAEIETYLRDYLNVSKIIWLGEGIVGDDTDGHIDDIARFVDEHTIVCAVEEDTADPNYELLQDNLARLRHATDAQGRPFRVVTLPMPGIIEGRDGRLPASYANFYIANALVLAPVFGHANDAHAVSTLQSFFPTRRVMPTRAEDLVWGMGTIHCLSQQQPAA